MTDEQPQSSAGTPEPTSAPAPEPTPVAAPTPEPAPAATAAANAEATAQPVAAGVTKADIEKNKVWAAISYLGIIGIIIALVCEAKDSPFVKFHLNQSIGLLIASVVAFAVAMVPVLGWIIAPLLWLVILVFMVMGLINAAQGQLKRLPLIGNFDLIK